MQPLQEGFEGKAALRAAKEPQRKIRSCAPFLRNKGQHLSPSPKLLGALLLTQQTKLKHSTKFLLQTHTSLLLRLLHGLTVHTIRPQVHTESTVHSPVPSST